MFYPFFNPTPHLKVQQFEFILYFKSVFPLANFSFWRRIKTSSDVCWSLRWKTLRNAALDNNSVQPLFCQTAGALKYETAIKSTDCFSVLGGTVVWFGRKFKGCLCQTGNSLGILAGCIHTYTHTFMHCRPWPVYFPCCLMSCSCQLWSKPTALHFKLTPSSSWNSSKYLLNHHDTKCKYKFTISAAFLHISPTLNSSRPLGNR